MTQDPAGRATAGTTRVLIADDQTLIRTALATMLAIEDDLDVVAQAESCGAAVHQAASTQPDVVLLDVQMPAGGLDVDDGIDALPHLLAAAPEARVIVVTTFGRPGYLRRALEAGAIGFLVKDTPVDRLIDGIRKAAAGLRVVDPELAAASLSIGASPLSEKEGLVLAASTGGVSTSEIARTVHLSEGTVRNYLSSAIGKLGARNRAEALRLATENGWV
ncbi:MAG TPA: response regulator transcription factor [Propionibacterium sp.]|nr:response regulator transcription factor [Propionibacterium sp.]